MDPISIALALAQFAPQIMRFLGAGQESAAAAQKVVDVAAAVASVADPQVALEKIRASTELQARFQERLLAARLELEQLSAADLKDARARDLELRKLNAGKNERADAMIVGAVIGLIACLVVLVFFRKDIPGEAVGIISTIAGIFGACLRDAFQFEFGSSRGSKSKDAALIKLASEP